MRTRKAYRVHFRPDHHVSDYFVYAPSAAKARSDVFSNVAETRGRQIAMGFNTVLVVLNDHVDIGAKDPNLGKRILDAVRSWTSPRNRQDLRIGSYGQVISQDHADGHQVVIVHGNTGWRLDDPGLPAECLKALEWQLKEIRRAKKSEGGR